MEQHCRAKITKKEDTIVFEVFAEESSQLALSADEYAKQVVDQWLESYDQFKDQKIEVIIHDKLN